MNVLNRGLRVPVCFVLCLLIAALPLAAQTSFGRVSGSVTDPTGAAVPAAKVTITNTETGIARSAETDQNGFYVITNLPIGPYKIEVNQTGFQKSQQSGLAVVADGRLTAEYRRVRVDDYIVFKRGVALHAANDVAIGVARKA